MKKRLLSLLAVAAGLFMASCSNEEMDLNTTSEEALVSFSINVEDGAATRAISDGTKANKLITAVYDVNGNELSALRQLDDINGKTATVQIALAKGQTYKFAFWAHKGDENGNNLIYNTDDLKNILIDYAKVVTNDDERDAFFANTTVTVSGDFKQEITLKRPFAQLNFAVSDLAAAKAAGVDLKQAKVVVKEVAQAINALTNTVSGLTTATFGLADVYAKETLSVELDGQRQSFPLLAMNYLLVHDVTTGAASSNTDVEFTFTTANADIVIPVLNVPVQRNWRTNIIGKLTSQGEFKIVVDPDFDGTNINNNGTEETYGVKASDGKLYKTIADAITAGATDIQLAEGEYTLPTDLNVTKDKSIVVTGTSTDVSINISNNAKPVGAFAKLTLNDVTIASVNENYAGITANEITFNNCVLENNYWCYSSTATFNDCTFEQSDKGFYNVWTYNSNVDFNNCVFNCAGKAALVYGERSSNEEWRTINFKACEFIASAPVDGKAAIEIDTESRKAPANVNIENCTATGFGKGNISGNSLYNIKIGTEGVNCNLTVTIADGVKLVAGEYYISSAEGMFWFSDEVNINKNKFSGKTIKLMNDVDLNNTPWEPIGQTGATQFMGIFDGGENTIFNLNVDNSQLRNNHTAVGLFGWLNAATVKNVKVKNATIVGNHYAGTIAGYMETAGCNITNCHVVNAVVSGRYHEADFEGDKVGGIVGYAGNTGTPIENCSVSDSQIDAVRDAGQVVGMSLSANVKSCTATNVTVSNNNTVEDPDSYYKENAENIKNELIGRTK